MSFKFYKQFDGMDCGPTCLRMVAKYYGRSVSLDNLRNRTQYGKEGVTMLGLAEAAEAIGLKSAGVKITFDELLDDTEPESQSSLVIAEIARGVVARIELREEGLEKAVHRPGLEADPTVGNPDLDFSLRVQARTQGNMAAVGGELDGVG